MGGQIWIAANKYSTSPKSCVDSGIVSFLQIFDFSEVVALPSNAMILKHRFKKNTWKLKGKALTSLEVKYL
jgi:hypothetical protein